MRIFAIDPGTTQSGWVMYDAERCGIVEKGIHENSLMINMIGAACLSDAPRLAIEMIGNYGMAVGRTTFETCVWIGRFMQSYGHCLQTNPPFDDVFVYRREVKLHLCNSNRAKDPNIRRAILDRFPATGGGKTPEIGTKKQPGPLYGVKSHIWSALGVALTYAAQIRDIDAMKG